MKTRPDTTTEERIGIATIPRHAKVPMLSGGIIRTVVALGFLVCTSWTDCSAYAAPIADLFNPESEVRHTSLSDKSKGAVTVGRDDRLPVPESRRGISRVLKRTRETDLRMPEHEWSALRGMPLGETMPSPGFRPYSGPRAAEHASREVGLFGWSDDLRRHVGLIFDREQRVLADRLTPVPPLLDAGTGLGAPYPAPMLPGRLLWPDPNAYEIWVAELLGL